LGEEGVLVELQMWRQRSGAAVTRLLPFWAGHHSITMGVVDKKAFTDVDGPAGGHKKRILLSGNRYEIGYSGN